MRKIIFIIGVLLLLFGCKIQQDPNTIQKAALDEIIRQFVDVSKDEGAPQEMSIAQLNSRCYEVILCSDSHILKHWMYVNSTLTESSSDVREKILNDDSLFTNGIFQYNKIAIANFMINGTNVQIDMSFGSLYGWGNMYALSHSNVFNVTKRLWVS